MCDGGKRSFSRLWRILEIPPLECWAERTEELFEDLRTSYLFRWRGIALLLCIRALYEGTGILAGREQYFLMAGASAVLVLNIFGQSLPFWQYKVR